MKAHALEAMIQMINSGWSWFLHKPLISVGLGFTMTATTAPEAIDAFVTGFDWPDIIRAVASLLGAIAALIGAKAQLKKINHNIETDTDEKQKPTLQNFTSGGDNPPTGGGRGG